MQEQDHELTGVELLRFLCALAVLLWHYQHFLFFGPISEAAPPAIRATFPMYAALFPAYDNGHLAVQGFWAISGYIFYWRYAQRLSNRTVGFEDFAARRFSRLYPLHFVTLLAVGAGQYVYFATHGQTFIYADNSATAFASQLFFASNWFEWQNYSFNAPIWSVSAEILTYLGFVGLVRFLGPSAPVALLAAAISWGLMRFPPSFLNSFVPLCGLFFFAGGAAQRLCRGRLALPLAASVGTATLLLLALGVIEANHKWLLTLAICAVVFFAQLSTTRARLVLRPVSIFGNATYSSYLLHFPMQIAIVLCVDALGLSRAWLFNAPALLCYLAAVITCSMAVYHWFERPAQNWIRKSIYRKRGNRAMTV